MSLGFAKKRGFMRNNQPVTQTEQKFVNKDDLVSITDLQGKIKSAEDKSNLYIAFSCRPLFWSSLFIP